MSISARRRRIVKNVRRVMFASFPALCLQRTNLSTCSQPLTDVPYRNRSVRPVESGVVSGVVCDLKVSLSNEFGDVLAAAPRLTLRYLA